MGTKTYIGKDTALGDVSRFRLWPLMRDDSSLVVIGAAGSWRSDWRRLNVVALIGQSTCRLLALAREAIDSTRAWASGSLQSATT